MPTINGARGAYPQPQIFGVNEAGHYVVQTWVGTTIEIETMIPAILAAGGLYEVEKGYTGAADRITARFPSPTSGGEEVVNEWEIFAEEVEKDILQIDDSRITGLSPGDRHILRVLLRNGPDATFQALPTDPFAKDLYNQILLGLTSKKVPVQHLRHTQTISSIFPITHSLANVERILSRSTLIAAESIIPTDIQNQMPDDVSTRGDMAYGWYKKRATVRTSAGHKTQVEQEWEYGLWSTLVYKDVL